MSKRFHTYKLLLDENMPARTYFERLNHLSDVKHIVIDLNISGLSDEKVYQEALFLITTNEHRKCPPRVLSGRD